MALSKRLPNYLLRERKAVGLYQDELAILLGLADGHSVGRHERFKRVPTLDVALAYEVIFGVPVSELFAGMFDDVERAVLGRAKALLAGLPADRTADASPIRRAWLERLTAMVATLDSRTP